MNQGNRSSFYLCYILLCFCHFMFRIAFCKDNLVKTHTDTIFWNIYSKNLYILNGRGKKKDSFAVSVGEKGMRLNGISAQCRHPLTSVNN